MIRPSFDQIYMDLAVSVARKSHCIMRHVGAVITKDDRVISLGYNGPPAKTHNCDEEWPNKGCDRDKSGGCSLAIHAEQNAISFALNNGISIKGSTIYVTLSPCISCAKLILNSKIDKVLYLESYAKYKGWNSDEGIDFLTGFGIECIEYHPQD